MDEETGEVSPPEPRLYVIDVGMSRAYGAKGSAGLEIMIRNQGATRHISLKGIHQDGNITYVE